MIIRGKSILALVVVVAFALGNCESLQPIDEDPHITGEITRIDTNRQDTRILVEEDPDINDPRFPGGEKILFRLTSETETLTRQSDGSLHGFPAESLKIDQQVEGWTIGGVVIDTQPRQGTAQRIIVVNDYPEWELHSPPPAEWLEIELTVPEEAESGQAIELGMWITNTSDQPVVLQVVTGQQYSYGPDAEDRGLYDFAITGSPNRLHWRYYYGDLFEDSTIPVPLSSGESITLTRPWEGQNLNGNVVAPGSYEVTGLYKVVSIEDEQGNTLLENEAGFYTSGAQAIAIQ